MHTEKEFKTCSMCKELKAIGDFYIKKKIPLIFRSECKKCKNSNDWKRKIKKRGYAPVKKMTQYPSHLTKEEKNKIYSLNNKEKIKESQKRYREKNKEKLKEYARNYRIQFKDVVKSSNKKYKEQNKEKIRATRKEYQAYRIRNDPSFKMRRIISKEISRSIRKNRESFLKRLPYSLQELKEYIESIFEPWMNWQNWGTYDPKTWDDADSNTWKWQIDHITPQSELPFSSYDDENFKKCWSLNNLRPYSAKLNILDGTNRVRHKKEEGDGQ